jgi:hypothetical protein
MKVIRFIMLVAVAAAIGITIAECRATGSIDWQNKPVLPPANSR